MDAKKMLILNQWRSEIQWIIKLRNAPSVEKVEMIITKCPCCVRRIISNSFMLSDEELGQQLQYCNEGIEYLCTEVDINPIL